ncbi:MAG: class I SAM-dependent methyltransferase [Deltaproteobacteria bacterium]|nr:class I SAM-dependent methyltransferase [Deltaproteobacteria bacterium]MBW2652786.1 class I SAM-dependent methyltransferase [Deltaproteobacteria bacterium]
MVKPKLSTSNKNSEQDTNKQIRHTADVVAVIRYKEGEKESPLIYDPFARLFVSPQGEEMLKTAIKSWPFFSDYLIVRAKFIDDHLRDFCKKEAVKQIVILGAGNDMRAARLNFLKGRKVFEVDFPDQITNKKQILKKELGTLPENVICVGANLKETSLSNTLSQAGFNREEKSAFILEGLIYYLTPEDVDHLFEELFNISPPGNFFLLDHISQDMSQKSPASEKSTKLPYPEDPIRYLNNKGFKIIESALLGNLTAIHFGKSYKERWWVIAFEK